MKVEKGMAMSSVTICLRVILLYRMIYHSNHYIDPNINQNNEPCLTGVTNLIDYNW